MGKIFCCLAKTMFSRFKQPVTQDLDSTIASDNGDSNNGFENDDGSLQSFGSITRYFVE